MRVFLSATSLDPAYGGPAFSVSRLACALAEAGVDVGVWASDQSAGTTKLLASDTAVRRLAGSLTEALDRFGGVTVIHDNGIWLPHNHALAKLADRRGIPRIVSTRGMLEPWAMNHKRWKKRVAWRAYQRRDLARAKLHHATADIEADNLRQLKLGVPIRMIPNGVDLPEMARAGRPAGGPARTALFLGRIYPVKGLPMLVEAWARVLPQGWRLQIVGPDEGGHRAEVALAVSSAGLGDVVSFLGPLEGPAKQAALFGADLLVLPSHSESFGMVVAEALAHGLPVLTTTAAPWPGLADHACGWRVEPTVAGLVEGLRSATSCDSASLCTMGARGRAMVAAEFGWQGVALQFVAAYEQMSRVAP